MSRALEEHDYIGLSEVSSIGQASDKTKVPPFSDKSSKGLNFKATELRLGLPGSESPERVLVVDDNGANHSLDTINNIISGAKRGFSGAINGSSDKWVLAKNGVLEAGILKNVGKDDEKLQSSPVSGQGTPALAPSKAVGWPPIRSFRKNSMAVNPPKIGDNKDCKLESGCLYIKVSMDGAPYLRKIDLTTYGSYIGLSSALEKMFSGFTMGEYSNQGIPCQDESSKDRSKNNLHSSEYVLTYEDKDGDWMLVGDVPWSMFIDSCRRLRIMKSSEAVGLETCSELLKQQNAY